MTGFGGSTNFANKRQSHGRYTLVARSRSLFICLFIYIYIYIYIYAFYLTMSTKWSKHVVNNNN
jgi:hypothetical protein